jgi:hypothetical protein
MVHTMWEQINDIMRRAGVRTAENVADFLPGLVGLLIILLTAAVIALVVRALVLRVLKGLHFDRHAEQMGFTGLVGWSTDGPSVVVSRAVMWLVVAIGLLIGLSALDAALPSQFALTIFHYLPDLLAALAILVVGNLLARFVARSVLIGAVNLQLQSARLLSVGVKWLLLVLAWAMALEHLGIGGQILTLAFGIAFGAIALALALAVGLGSKDAVSRSLERQLREPAGRPDELKHV